MTRGPVLPILTGLVVGRTWSTHMQYSTDDTLFTAALASVLGLYLLATVIIEAVMEHREENR